MSRAKGRRVRAMPRPPAIQPGTPEGDYIGLSDRQTPGPESGQDSPIPGGARHISQPDQKLSVTKPPDEPQKPPHRGMMAHGVPAEHEDYPHHDRVGAASPGPSRVPTGKHQEPAPAIPVPVYVVEGPGSGGRALLRAVVRRITCPASGTADPVLVAGQDSTMKKIRILNEDTSHAARWSSELSGLVSGAGALIPVAPAANQGTYLEIETQETVYIASNDSGTPIVSVIIEYDARGKVVK